jgi:hypothetical protein
MLRAAKDYMREFYVQEDGQGISEYGSTLAWMLFTFGAFAVIALGIQHGFINTIANTMAGGLNGMASNASHMNTSISGSI